MSDLNLDAADQPLDLSRVPLDFIAMLFQRMSLSDRFRCALVCKAWAQEAAAATTRSIILRDRIQDLSCLQRWLQKYGGQVEVLQLHDCHDPAVLTALPCPQLQDLLLRGRVSLDGSVWLDIAAATKLTSVSLDNVLTASQQAGVVSALTALPDLEQLTCEKLPVMLTDSMLLQKLTKLTALKLGFSVSAEVLGHLGLLTRLQDLSLSVANWAEAGCPGLQEAKTLTRLELSKVFLHLPANVGQLTALQQLDVSCATPAALNKLSALTGLTHLRVLQLENLWLVSPPLQLSGLQSLRIDIGGGTMPMALLANCTQLRVLVLRETDLSGPGSLVASSMLQHLELHECRVSAADEAAEPASWQHVLQGPGRLPHLTFLKITPPCWSDLQHADIECAVSCCSNLQVLDLNTLPANSCTALTRLSGLTSLTLRTASDQQCSSLAQLTGLRELRVRNASEVFAAGLRQLAALEQLTSLELHSLGCKIDVLKGHMLDGLSGPGTDKCVLINQVCVCSTCHMCRTGQHVASKHVLIYLCRLCLSSDRCTALYPVALRCQRLHWLTPTPTLPLPICLMLQAPAGQPPDVSAQLRRACNMATAADS